MVTLYVGSELSILFSVYFLISISFTSTVHMNYWTRVSLFFFSVCFLISFISTVHVLLDQRQEMYSTVNERPRANRTLW